MNKKIDLTKILKDCPDGTMFYSSVFGTVLVNIEDDLGYPIRLYKYRNKSTVTSCRLTKYGELYEYFDGECILFPSKDQRDWSKFTAPWLKKERFDPKTFQPFDKVLVRTGTKRFHVWLPDLISIPPNEVDETILCMTIDTDIIMVVPYNEETKHLVGTNKEAPEFYRYWED